SAGRPQAKSGLPRVPSGAAENDRPDGISRTTAMRPRSVAPYRSAASRSCCLSRPLISPPPLPTFRDGDVPDLSGRDRDHLAVVGRKPDLGSKEVGGVAAPPGVLRVADQDRGAPHPAGLELLPLGADRLPELGLEGLVDGEKADDRHAEEEEQED